MTDAREKLQGIMDNFQRIFRRWMDNPISKSDHVFDCLDHQHQLETLMAVLCENYDAFGSVPAVDPAEVSSPGR